MLLVGSLTSSKYYSDKQKLVLNGIIQIDNILHNSKVISLKKNTSCYVVDRISIVDFPCLKKSLIEGAGNFIDSFLKSKEMAVKTHEIVLKSSRNTRKTVEDLTPAELSRDSKLPRRILWLKPDSINWTYYFMPILRREKKIILEYLSTLGRKKSYTDHKIDVKKHKGKEKAVNITFTPNIQNEAESSSDISSSTIGKQYHAERAGHGSYNSRYCS
ncbi:hypothetical protein BDF21DRAFT_454626 [Thamnidium elegans]|nr:hypothetical protein BDF21DRAFT_454626 [Thamnidium elegans]